MHEINRIRNDTYYDLGKKNEPLSEKVWKMGQKYFLYMKFTKKRLYSLSDVLPQFTCCMALIAMELLCTLERYLSSPTFDY